MTRLWSNGATWGIGLPIEVDTQNSANDDSAIYEMPIFFTWQNQKHPVVEITKTWRVDIDWWRERVWRAYFKLRTETGLLVIIYQDLLSGAWYLQRLYD